MAKRDYPRRTRARRFGQLMLLSAALMNTPFGLAELDREVAVAAETAVPALSERELLLYLGEFDPELDPVEISQMNDALAEKTDAKTSAEADAHEPK
jgi:hypothetical protein